MCYPLLGKKIKSTEYLDINLSQENPILDFRKTSNPKYLEQFIFSELEKNNVKYGIGGYLEKRNIYSISKNFSPERNIHLAIDIWAKVGTQIFGTLDGEVHSFKNNDLPYDYGGTIILKHEEDGNIFHTLYGHLSLSSLIGLKIGKFIKKGTPFCQIGNWDENGGWPSHLHFQKIINMENYEGDYVGVCEKKDLEYYKINCPNSFPLTSFERK